MTGTLPSAPRGTSVPPAAADRTRRQPTVSWVNELVRLITHPDTMYLVFQPIVDVARGAVAGCETLARFTDADSTPSRWTPDRWLAAADGAGMGAQIEALVLERCLRLRADLPPNCYLLPGTGAMIWQRAPLAQRREQVPSKHLTAGSIPAGRATWPGGL